MIKVIDFHAEWCGPCDQQDEIIEELQEENPDLEIEKVDIDENMERANDYSVRSVPTIVIERDGVPVEKFDGVTQREKIEEALDEL